MRAARERGVQGALKWVVRRAGLPAMAAGFAAAVITAPEAGFRFLLAAAAAGLLLEFWMPYEQRWNGWNKESVADLFAGAAAAGSSVALQWGLTEILPPEAGDDSFWLSLPMPVRIAAALVLSGFVPYWLHRIAHERGGILWDLHAMHHSPQRVNGTNALRSHPLNAMWNTAGGILPLLLLGADRDTILIAGSINSLFSIFNHMNIDFSNPLLSRVLNTADLHRWHHASDPAFGNSNYASGALCVWDQVFGTWNMPERRMRSSEAGLYAQSRGFKDLPLWRQLWMPVCRCM